MVQWIWYCHNDMQPVNTGWKGNLGSHSNWYLVDIVKVREMLPHQGFATNVTYLTSEERLKDDNLVDELDVVGEEVVERWGLPDAPGCPGGSDLAVLNPVVAAVVNVLQVLSLIVLKLKGEKWEVGGQSCGSTYRSVLPALAPGWPGRRSVGRSRSPVAWLRCSVATGVRLPVWGVAGGGEEVDGGDRPQQGDQHWDRDR